MTFIGYARVSTIDQNLDLQVNKLKEKGCIRIFTDKISGAKDDRKELTAALEYIRPGDVLVVWKLDRLGRSLRHLIDTIEGLQEREIGFISLTENIDTTTSGGKLIFHIMGALAQFERELIRERTNAGLEAARARGKKGGRKPLTSDDTKVKHVRMLYANNESIEEICKSQHISRATLYRYINKDKQEGKSA